jgi:hypothetical protein
MYADDVAVWHNVTQRALDKSGSLDLLRYWASPREGSPASSSTSMPKPSLQSSAERDLMWS